MEKIGLGIVTYNRPEYLKQCLEAASKNNWGGAEHIYVYDDCSDNWEEIRDICKQYDIQFTRGLENKGVATAKNVCLKRLIDLHCEHLFIMEDDMLITHEKICDYYISYAQKNYLKHLNFALHGPLNKGKRSFKSVKWNMICVYPDCVGAFSYYHKDVIEEVGYIDENFINAWEHVEHTYRIAQAGLTTPFWYFADHPFSERFIKEIEGSIEKSSIRPRSDWSKNINEGQKYWIKKHGEFLPPRPQWVIR